MLQSAAKNLNGADIQGQQIRVDLADAERQNTAELTSHQYATMKTEKREPHIREREALELHTRLAADDIVPNGVIAEIMEGFPDEELFLLLAHMKQLVLNSPDQARQMLVAYPQLSCALLHGQMMANMRQVVEPPLSSEELDKAVAQKHAIQMTFGMGVPGRPAVPPPIEAITIEQRKLLIAKLALLAENQLLALPPLMKEQILGYLEQIPH